MKRLIPALLLVALLPACATITSGTTQSIAVLTQPAGATCNLTRDAGVIAVVNPTPGTANISKSSTDIAVNCTRADHHPGAAVIPSKFQAATLGNILLGGVVGLAVDAASGAMSRYPENVTVVLAPMNFTSETERMAFFDARIVETRQEIDERVVAIRRDCPAENPVPCQARVETLQRQRDERVQELERQRNTPGGAESRT